MRTFVKMFKLQFAGLVESGEKRQTILPKPKRMPKPGDKISLRTWTAKPYRSKQQVLREATITEVESVTMTCWGITIRNLLLSDSSEEELAKADGFNNRQELWDWFRCEYGLPFEGIIIKWDPNK